MRKLFFNRWLGTIFVLLFVATVGYGFYNYYIAGEYDYIVEAPCDPSAESCFYRDCSIEDECPPNELEDYKQFYVRAKDFGRCTENSCTNLCQEDAAACRPIPCDESAGDMCVRQTTL